MRAHVAHATRATLNCSRPNSCPPCCCVLVPTLSLFCPKVRFYESQGSPDWVQTQDQELKPVAYVAKGCMAGLSFSFELSRGNCFMAFTVANKTPASLQVLRSLLQLPSPPLPSSRPCFHPIRPPFSVTAFLRPQLLKPSSPPPSLPSSSSSSSPSPLLYLCFHSDPPVPPPSQSITPSRPCHGICAHTVGPGGGAESGSSAHSGECG